ncbi:MAG: 50S ribosomal protein L10 [Clostridiales bacterium]|nr:50S ribosomal protein L10 [Clostridiales bacterium]
MPSQKILDAKKKMVAELVSDYRNAKSFVFADARGLKVSTDTEMRADLRKNNVSYKVVKNTTATLIFKELGIQGVEDILKGPTAIAYSTEDAIVPAKILKQYADKFDKLTLKGGIIEGKVASADEVKILAKIPSKEVLYGQIAYGLLFPMTKLAMLLKAAAEKVQEEGPIETKVEKKADSKEEPVVEAKEEAKTEEAPAVTEEAKAEPVVEAKEEAKTEEAPAVTEEAKAEPIVEAKEEAKVEPVAEAVVEAPAEEPAAEAEKEPKPAKKTTKPTTKKAAEAEEAKETKE